ncbi:hypothetical protein GPJ56_001555 [Histomonas meleagridis]|uniref:uncharacterized protein n=1 Tax=Histomonas meleagridis TaxID=135588 RepID=UPI00355A7A25|nr:hypothetical protein GPJ56_001555 [Histomonas meleagridis]KAH0807061.1 hypothetical protein GO595_000237 [Histomonas meleagridis]
MSFSDVDTGLPNYPDLIPGYTPYIGDSSQLPAEPFVIPFVDNRSDEEIDLIRHSLRPIIQKTEFDSPIPVADFCLVAIQRWEDDDDISDSEISLHLCEIQ